MRLSRGARGAGGPAAVSAPDVRVSSAGYQWCDIEKCVKWMVPFAMVIREAGSSKLKQFRGVPPEDAHNIQTHLNSLDLLVSHPALPPRRDSRSAGAALSPVQRRLLDCSLLFSPHSPLGSSTQ